MKDIGFPVMMANYLAVIFIMLPFQLGVLLREAKKKTGTFSIKAIIPYQDKIAVWQYFVIVPLLLVWVAAIFSLFEPVDQYLIEKLFYFVPDWFHFANDNLSDYTRSALIITLSIGFILNGIAAPLVEELYFRGYLLPRISRYKGWSVVLNVVFFSLYHFFSPWQNFARIIGLLPMVYAVYWKRNVWIGVSAHIAVNSLSTLLLINLFFK